MPHGRQGNRTGKIDHHRLFVAKESTCLKSSRSLCFWEWLVVQLRSGCRESLTSSEMDRRIHRSAAGHRQQPGLHRVFQRRQDSRKFELQSIHGRLYATGWRAPIPQTGLDPKNVPALMEQEDRFFAALQRVGKVQFAEGLLVLLDADDEVLLKANRRP